MHLDPEVIASNLRELAQRVDDLDPEVLKRLDLDISDLDTAVNIVEDKITDIESEIAESLVEDEEDEDKDDEEDEEEDED